MIESQSRTVDVQAMSQDGQVASVRVYIHYQPEIRQLPLLFSSYGPHYAERIVPYFEEAVRGFDF